MNFRLTKCCLIFALLFCLSGANNWNSTYKRLVDYHDSGAYYQDISGVIKEATFYLQFRLTQNIRNHHPRKLAIVMDIDETALSNYNKLKALHFHITPQQFRHIEATEDDPAIPYTLALYNYAKSHHVAIFFVTGRPSTIATSTVRNLNKAGYRELDSIHFNPSETVGTATIPYRIKSREQIQHQGYDIVMNIGIREETLTGGNSDMTFQLPNPFYHI